jgi:hypothetical protein
VVGEAAAAGCFGWLVCAAAPDVLAVAVETGVGLGEVCWAQAIVEMPRSADANNEIKNPRARFV